MNEEHKGFIKGQARGKLTGCERDLALNLPGVFIFSSYFLSKKNLKMPS